MMFRRKDLSAKQGPRCRPPPCRGAALFFCCVIVFSSNSGIIEHAAFSGGPAPDSLIVADSIFVAVARPNIMCKAIAPTIKDSVTSRPQLPDVYATAQNQFRFFWSDSCGKPSQTVERICRRDITILPTSIDTSSSPVVTCFASQVVNYLHANRSNNYFLASFIQSSNSLSAGYSVSNALTGIGGAVTNASQCFFKADTFLVIYIKSASTVVCKRIYFSAGAALNQSLTEVVLATDLSNSNSWVNPSITADSSGNVCALWLRGNANMTIPNKKIIYGLYDSLFNRVIVDSFPDNTDAPGAINYYDDASVVSYAKRKFASVTWDQGGILMRFFEIKTPTQADTSTYRIKTDAVNVNCRFPSVATNGRFIAFSWMQYSDDKKSVGIRCVRYPITNGVIDVSRPSQEYPIADTTLTAQVLLPNEYFILNSAMDSTGNMAFCWHLKVYAQAGVWANRDLLRNSGSWISPPDSLPARPIDSVSFTMGTVLMNPASIVPSSQDTLDSLYLSIDNGATWNFYKNAASPAQVIKGPYKYFQYKIKLKRVDSLVTPAIKKVTFQWSAKPRIGPLDSVAINSVYQPGKHFGDTISCLSRSDTVRCRLGIISIDTLDTVYTGSIRKGRTIPDSVNRNTRWWTSDTILPLTKSDTISWQFTAHGKSGWAAHDSGLCVKTHNAVPRLSVQTIRNNGGPVTETGATRINVQQSDSIEFMYSVQDSNDAGTLARLFLNGAKVDSIPQINVGHYMFHCASGRPQGDVFRFTAKDPDDSTVTIVNCGVNHFPVINSISVKGAQVNNGDTVRVGIGASTPIIVHAFDADIGYGDSLSFLFRRGSLPDTILKDSVYAYVPQRSDTSVRIYVSDLAGKTDSTRFYIKFPWFETDSTGNRALLTARKILNDSVALIIGSGTCDTIAIPIKNTGNDTMSITSLQFKAVAGQWLRILVSQNDTIRLFDSLESNSIRPLKCAPNGTVVLRALLCADSLKGDHMAFDSIIIGADDAMHNFDTLPVRLKYNDLPRIFSLSFDFAFNTPYWLAKSKAVKTAAYVFPPHAKISITFSEPVDSASVVPNLKIYSIYDMSIDPNGGPVPLSYQWSQGKTRLDISPHYSHKSPYFKIMPPDGFFIPTDSLKLVVSSTITDTAHAPNGPNAMDLHRIYALSPPADTSFLFRVDSITYTITSVSPDSGAAGVAPQSAISLTFSSPPFPGTIDTSKVNNRALIVGSLYSGPGRINFDSIYVKNATAYFIPAKKFFYHDTVHCYYHGGWARDSLGYSVDLNKDGIPMSMFDSTSTSDDKQWSFTVKDIVHTAVYPAPNAISMPPDTFITVSFSDSIKSGIIDTSKKNNRSFQAFSRCSRGAPLALDSIKISGTKASFRPSGKLYYGDSVTCVYQGLSTLDSTGFAIGGSNGGALFTKDKFQWGYTVKSINLVSTMPDSAKTSVTVHPEIVLRFSAPVYRGTFDSDTSTHNRSFQLTSTYTKDSSLTLGNVVFSSDSTQIHITPKASFFANDSVQCVFKGFKKSITYDQTNNLPGDSSPMICSRSWYFFVQNEGFYTYPNPYKPGSDPRHCSANGPCGIWFKNLHILKRGISEVSIKIFTMNAFPIYNTQSAGVHIRFLVGNADLKPEWKWDTRNQHGTLVASGLYFYAIYDPSGGMIMKGKLMIVR
jgi:hypothetical protein